MRLYMQFYPHCLHFCIKLPERLEVSLPAPPAAGIQPDKRTGSVSFLLEIGLVQPQFSLHAPQLVPKRNEMVPKPTVLAHLQIPSPLLPARSLKPSLLG